MGEEADARCLIAVISPSLMEAAEPPVVKARMGNPSREKGINGEREVAAIFEREGFEVRGLEGTGDHLCIARPKAWPSPLSLTIHSEVKRQERLQLWQWLAQLEAEAPPGTLPMLSFRRNRSPWYACVPLEALVKVLA